MAEEKKVALEREYIIPLRKYWKRMPFYRRAGRVANTIKTFVAKHMKIVDRDLDKVRIDPYLNSEIWFRGMRHPPAKIKVIVKKVILEKEGEIVRVYLAEVPEHVKFLKAKDAKFHQKFESEKEKKEELPEPGKEDKKEDNAEEKKKVEVEKEKAVEIEKEKASKKEKNIAKHTTKVKGTEIQRKALNRH